ncbi:MAG TPA: polysaccharide deacetylase family protein [Thermoanaerobaculia bacterium]|jgi:hypothetical protein|nr:polysaccharide deacetylase family protein [Thermoanaerobaculia bacterium]
MESLNPLLRRLGFSAGDRVVLLHADDLGMCQATIPAFAELLEAGLVSTGSVMVPSPWFSAVAVFCRGNPAADVGVHLTLTSEWQGYRWRPVSTRDPATGLVDAEGYLHARTPAVADGADPAAVRSEIEAQMDLARRAGIDVTHADTHMLTLLAPRLLAVFREAAEGWALPVPMLSPAREVAPLSAGSAAEEVAGLLGRRGAWPAVCDHWVTLRLRRPEDRLAQAKRLFDALPPGLTQVSIHPALDTPELRAIAPDWRCRVADWQTFRSGELRDHLRRTGIQVIGYRAVREAAAG